MFVETLKDAAELARSWEDGAGPRRAACVLAHAAEGFDLRASIDRSYRREASAKVQTEIAEFLRGREHAARARAELGALQEAVQNQVDARRKVRP